MSRRQIAPELFDYISDAAEALDHATLYESISPSSAVREFYRNFYAQFFENVLGVGTMTISLASAREANVLAKKHREWSPQARALVRRFQKLCKLDPDLRGGDYGGSSTVYREFHASFVPDLLEEIALWARAEGHNEIADRASSGADKYRATIERIDSEPGV